MKKTIKIFLFCLVMTLGTGLLSALVLGESTALYIALLRPPLSPPSWVFPVVWTVLYVLMAVSATLILIAPPQNKTRAILLFILQLVANFLWPIFFFSLSAFWFAFVWLMLLWLLIVAMLEAFADISRPAALLQLPYLLWVSFAGYLNAMIAFWNT